jgi:hypothetical protein
MSKDFDDAIALIDGYTQSHDYRYSHNPPPLVSPAMEQEQFEYDNQREIEASLLAVPQVMAQHFLLLRDRVEFLEAQLASMKGDT